MKFVKTNLELHFTQKEIDTITAFFEIADAVESEFGDHDELADFMSSVDLLEAVYNGDIIDNVDVVIK